jgi:4-hydroxy-3-polyprenylbenzoate decarboxylase
LKTALAYKDLRGYLDAADRLGELRRVNGADWDLELGAITEVAARANNPQSRFVRRHQGLSEGGFA